MEAAHADTISRLSERESAAVELRREVVVLQQKLSEVEAAKVTSTVELSSTKTLLRDTEVNHAKISIKLKLEARGLQETLHHAQIF